MIQAYPLQWPDGRPRTKYRERSRFEITFARARDHLAEELDRLGAKHPVLSTNVELRMDGRPRAGGPEPGDPGAAIYFQYKGKQMVFACDKYDLVRDNIRAIQKTIEAIRGIERWGTGDMAERAFTGFEALPAPGQEAQRHWRQVLGWATDVLPVREHIEDIYRQLAKRRHPDHGGSDALMAELNRARDEALRECA